MTGRMRGIEASWLWTGEVEAAPLARGAVVVDEEGAVVAVGAADALRAAHGSARWEAHEGVLLPGLVNARTSLELSALRGQVAGGRGFVPWLDALTTARERLEPELDAEAIDAGVSELIRTGTAAVGEVSRSLASLEALSTAPLLARVFHEVAGLRRETATVVRAMHEAQHEALTLPKNVGLALAPHSLVGLHPDALAALFEGPTIMPLAWTAAERAFLADGGGPLSRSFGPISGTGCSCIQMPTSRRLLTRAFIRYATTPISRPTSPKAAIARSRCSCSCAALICVRMRACPRGTTGKLNPIT